jgi:hypothetical protein
MPDGVKTGGSRMTKGVTMRRWSIVLLVLVVSVVSLVAAACGSTGSSSRLSPESHSPQEVLAAAYDTSYDLNSASGTFDVGLTVEADLSQVPADAYPLVQALTESGIHMSGAFAYANKPLVADYSFTLSMMGESLDMGVKMIGTTFWMSLGGRWYELPAEATQMFGPAVPEVDSAEVEQLLDDLGLDPVTWFDSLVFVGEESMDGVTVVQLSGHPDMMKIVNDSLELMRSDEFLALIDPSGSLAPGMLEGQDFPTVAEIEEIRSMMESVFSDMMVDLWVGEDDGMIRQTTLTGRIEPPPGEDAEGFVGMDMTVTMSLSGINQLPVVEPPASALPFEDLEEDIQENPDLLGPFSELLGLSGGYGTGGVYY